MAARKQSDGRKGNGRHGTTRDRGVTRLARQAAEGTLLYETKNHLPAETRARAVELMNRRLADCLDLGSQCKQAHWNVKGPQFIALHKLFDEIHEAVEEYIDVIAERVVQLGGIAEGTVRVAAGRSTLEEYPLVLSSGDDHVAALSTALARFGDAVREGVDQLDALGDADSTDILTEVSRGVDQWLWFVEAHQQREPVVTETASSARG